MRPRHYKFPEVKWGNAVDRCNMQMLKVAAVTISKYLLFINFMKNKKKKGCGQGQEGQQSDER